jgi:predicted secreted protein
LVIVLSLQRAEGSTEETGSSYTKTRILPLPRLQRGEGYLWAPALPNPTILRLANEQIEPLGRGTPGAEQTQVFTFVATAYGTEPLRFIYRQPWLPDAPSKYFTVTVTVTR